MFDLAGVYFAQLTDLHIGDAKVLSELNNVGIDLCKVLVKSAEQNFIDIIRELNSIEPPFSFILVTGDLVNAGTEYELKKYCQLSSESKISLWHIPTNHDLGKNPEVWKKLLGGGRHYFDEGEARVFLVSEYRRSSEGKWYVKISSEALSWLKEKLEEWSPKPAILALHFPILPAGDGTYADLWFNSNIDKLLNLVSRYNILGIITGHWHRNGEWLLKAKGNGRSIRLITTGSVMGQQWTGTPPHYYFPTRPGYRMFNVNQGKLYSFWREIRTEEQANLVWIGSVNTQGPRPQVRPVKIFSSVRLRAQAFTRIGEVVEMKWSLCSQVWRQNYQTGWKVHQWMPMNRVFEDLWSDWEAEFTPHVIKPGQYVLVVKAETDRGKFVYDAVPITVSGEHSFLPVEAGNETVFELFYPPEEPDISK